MSTSQPHDQAASETTSPQPSSETVTKTFRQKLQIVLLMFGVVGLTYAGWRGWEKRDFFLRFLGYNTRVVNFPATLPESQPINYGFDLSNAIISDQEIVSGNVPKDGIPALTDPKFVAAGEEDYLKADSPIIGVVFEEEARAYPLSILDSHEVINDRIGKTSFAVAYCPLCDSSVVYNRKTKAGEIELGVSGLLYNSNVLLYDRNGGDSKQESLWSQLQCQSVSGPRVKEQLETLPMEVTTWADWKKRYPKTKVLSTETGHQRRYNRSTYENYFTTEELYFSVNHTNGRLSNKSPVLGVWVGDKVRAYPINSFAHVKKPLEIEQELAGKKFKLAYNPDARSLRIITKNNDIKWMYSFWFAWYAFHPETDLFDDKIRQLK